MSGCLNDFLKRCVLVIAVISLTMAVNNPNLYAYGGGDGGGSDGGGDTSSISVTIDIFSLPLNYEPSGVSGATPQLQTPAEGQLRQVWEGLGGQAGTGQTLNDWKNSTRASRVLIQHGLEADLARTQTSSSRWNTAVVAVDVIDHIGYGAHVALSFIPVVNAPITAGLDAGRDFANVYEAALNRGASQVDAILQGMQSATVRGAASLGTGYLIGNAAGHTYNRASRITGNRTKDVAKRGANYLMTFGLKYTEFGTNLAIDVIRDNVSVGNNTSQPVYQTYQHK